MWNQEIYTKQERAWADLYDRIQRVMSPLGREDSTAAADYWLLDDNWGAPQHKLLISNLDLLAPNIITRLQETLADYPGWEIVASVAMKKKGVSWPDMGLTIRPHEIVDELRREFLPEPFKRIKYGRR
jgi:hypothetical protein